MKNCEIDCNTLKCINCGLSTDDCNNKRNCHPVEEKPRNNTTVSKIRVTPMKQFGGPGTELKKLLSKMGIDSTSGCKCSDRAKHMDYMEQKDPGWTERNIEEVLDWMQQEAKNRNLPFLRTPAKLLVKLAIRRAKKQ